MYKNKTDNILYNQKYRLENKDKIAKQRKEYRLRNRKVITKRNKIWRLSNRELYNKIWKDWAERNTNYLKPLVSIRRKTRADFPLWMRICEFCGNLATQHHHTTYPIKYNKFQYVCKLCHYKLHLEGKK